MPLSQVLNKLRDDGTLFWRRDLDFIPVKDRKTVRLFLSSSSEYEKSGCYNCCIQLCSFGMLCICAKNPDCQRRLL